MRDVVASFAKQLFNLGARKEANVRDIQQAHGSIRKPAAGQLIHQPKVARIGNAGNDLRIRRQIRPDANQHAPRVVHVLQYVSQNHRIDAARRNTVVFWRAIFKFLVDDDIDMLCRHVGCCHRQLNARHPAIGILFLDELAGRTGGTTHFQNPLGGSLKHGHHLATRRAHVHLVRISLAGATAQTFPDVAFFAGVRQHLTSPRYPSHFQHQRRDTARSQAINADVVAWGTHLHFLDNAQAEGVVIQQAGDGVRQVPRRHLQNACFTLERWAHAKAQIVHQVDGRRASQHSLNRQVGIDGNQHIRAHYPIEGVISGITILSLGNPLFRSNFLSPLASGGRIAGTILDNQIKRPAAV